MTDGWMSSLLVDVYICVGCVSRLRLLDRRIGDLKLRRIEEIMMEAEARKSDSKQASDIDKFLIPMNGISRCNDTIRSLHSHDHPFTAVFSNKSYPSSPARSGCDRNSELELGWRSAVALA